ncbi:MAG: VanZ family protein [Gemmatimonadales bacterium]|nr:VanZ family protein [Gemmatimonadales bacterium]MBP6570070.1 VanZ family protein [Gemmatimonadales bacterium]MBP7620691.1 VanZ family protein [Gemmatimonadales bacterium]
MTGRRVGALPLVLASLAVISLTTLGANPAQADRVAETGWSCLVCGDAGTTDVLLNLLLFLPLGIGLRLCGWNGRRAVIAMALFSLGIEATQALALAGRDASLSDILANSLGGAAGWWGWPRAATWRTRSLAHHRRGAALMIGLSTMVWLATGWGLRPNGSDAGPWVGQPLHRWRGHDPFPGTLQRVTVNRIDVPNDPLSSTPDLTDSVALTLDLTRHDAAPSDRPISLLRVVDGNQKLQLSVTQRGEALLVTARAQASRWRVRTPAWRFEGVMAIPPEVPWQLAWRWLGDRVELRSGPMTGDGVQVQAIALSIGLGWVFVHPFAAAIGAPEPYRWTALWLALFGVSIGWCLGWLPRRDALLGAALTTLAFAGASLATGLPVQSAEVALLLGWLSAGFAGGWYIQQRR